VNVSRKFSVFGTNATVYLIAALPSMKTQSVMAKSPPTSAASTGKLISLGSSVFALSPMTFPETTSMPPFPDLELQ